MHVDTMLISGLAKARAGFLRLLGGAEGEAGQHEFQAGAGSAGAGSASPRTWSNRPAWAVRGLVPRPATAESAPGPPLPQCRPAGAVLAGSQLPPRGAGAGPAARHARASPSAPRPVGSCAVGASLRNAAP